MLPVVTFDGKYYRIYAAGGWISPHSAHEIDRWSAPLDPWTLRRAHALGVGMASL